MWNPSRLLCLATLLFSGQVQGQTCSGDLVYKSCGTSCARTCENPDHQVCITVCVKGCFCPDDKPIRIGDTDQCAKDVDECPAVCSGDLVFRPCGTPCPVTCDNFQYQPFVCPSYCVEDCFCPRDKPIRIVGTDQCTDDFGECPPKCNAGFREILGSYCGRGPGTAPCDASAVCTIHPTDRYAVCCEEIPPSGGVIDDPHFKTWVGKWYDFMGECSLVLVHAPNFANALTLDIHIRTKIRYEYSYIESAAIKIGNDILEVASFGDYYLNSVAQVDKQDLVIAGFPIHYSQPTNKIHKFEIHVTAEERIVVKTFKDMVSVMVDNVQARHFHGSQGMMGELETGHMLARDGQTILEDPNDFATEWQVREDEGMLFQSITGPQYPQACKLQDNTHLKDAHQLRLGKVTIAWGAAEIACADWKEDTKDACIHDVIASGDIDLAAAHSF